MGSAAHDLLESSTIVAIATPTGRGGIGVVRLSGTHALTITQQLAPQRAELVPRVATYCLLHDDEGKRVDDALITYFAAPHSYTGEDLVEIATHGSPVILDWLVRQAVSLGAQPARPGEFTERAFLRGRLDLTQAEAVRDLIEAQTLGQAKQAAEQMGGAIANQVRPVKQSLVALIAALEAGIDFAEDDIDTMPGPEIARRLEQITPPLEALLASFVHGRLMREGMRLAIVGKPNAGKSSLFNQLVERERAIVTATPGTTRDIIAERIAIDGIPVELLDTAGLRETTDEAERMGVERSREAMADADAVLLVIDATADASDTTGTLEDLRLDVLSQRPVLVAWNKSDLERSPRNAPQLPSTWPQIQTSALTGAGIAPLREALLRMAKGNAQSPGGATLTSLRHREAVQRSLSALHQARQAIPNQTPHEMLLLDLYEALHALDELTGETTADNILHLIFSTFCIGK